MPIYEYHCSQCHIDFEVRRSFSDNSTPECPVCHETAYVVRKFSAPAIVFKGSGFYVTDSRGKNAAGAPARHNGSSHESEVSEAATAESKPASASESKSDAATASAKSD